MDKHGVYTCNGILFSIIRANSGIMLEGSNAKPNSQMQGKGVYDSYGM